MLLKFLSQKKIKTILIIFMLITAALFFGAFKVLNQKTFYKGVIIEGVDVSGSIWIGQEMQWEKS